jgi:uncharacterized SAM-binding protein YcdF (DUF218 family)
LLRILKIAGGLMLIAAGLLLVPAVRSRVLPAVAEGLDVGEDPECTRYVLILPGEETGRSLTAAALVRIGLAQDVLILQNPDSADVKDGITLPTARISSRILRHRGIPIDRVLLVPSESRTTFDDALALSHFLRGRGGDVTIVTSGFHTRRARFVFRRVLGPQAEQLHFFSAEYPAFSSNQWWQQREGLRLILTEYLKLAFYYVRYGGWWVWGAIALLPTIVACRLGMGQLRPCRRVPAEVSP